MNFTIQKLEEMSNKISEKEITSTIKNIELKQGHKLLEIGIGAGKYTLRFAEVVGSNGIIYAMDTKKEITDYVKSKANQLNLTNIKFIISDNPNINIEHHSLNFIYSRNAFHHLPNQIEYLRDLKQYLHDNGKLVIIDHKKGAPIPHHEDVLFTTDEVKKIGTEAGYKLYQELNVHKDKIFLIFTV